MILLIDNYDSFSYNLYQLIGSLEPDIRVIRNDAMTVDEIAALSASRSSSSWAGGSPFWASAWGTRPSAKRSVPP